MHGRRRFLLVAGASAGAMLYGCGEPTGRSAANGPVPGGNVKDVPVGSLSFVSGQPVILGRDASGLYAMTAICTHLQCSMAEDGSIGAAGVTCDCHGSRFDRNGAVTRGPAGAALEHYRVDLAADGTITIQAGTVVDAAARTKVP